MNENFENFVEIIVGWDDKYGFYHFSIFLTINIGCPEYILVKELFFSKYDIDAAKAFDFHIWLREF